MQNEKQISLKTKVNEVIETYSDFRVLVTRLVLRVTQVNSKAASAVLTVAIREIEIALMQERGLNKDLSPHFNALRRGERTLPLIPVVV